MSSSHYKKKKGPGPIPPRWLNCPRKSVTLIGPKFLAFKTPLSHKFDNQVPPQNQFTPAMLFSSMRSHMVSETIKLFNLCNFKNFRIKQ